MYAVAERNEIDHSIEIKILYLELFPKCASYIAKRGGNVEDAKDIFHDALILMIERKANDLILNEEAYIMTLVKNLWIKKIKKEQKDIYGGVEMVEALIPEDYFPNKKQLRLINFLTIAGRKCMDLLRSFYYEQKSIQQVAKEFNFSSLHSASAQKYKCIEKLRLVVKEKSIQYDDFE